MTKPTKQQIEKYTKDNIDKCVKSFREYLTSEVEKAQKDDYFDFQVEVRILMAKEPKAMELDKPAPIAEKKP